MKKENLEMANYKPEETVKVTGTYHITFEMIDSLLVSAFDGDYGYSFYWTKRVRPLGDWDKRNPFKFFEAMVKNGFEIWLKDPDTGEDDGKRKITPKKMAEALQLMADKWQPYFQDLVQDNSDAETGDVFAQLCVFGDVIYG